MTPLTQAINHFAPLANCDDSARSFYDRLLQFRYQPPTPAAIRDLISYSNVARTDEQERLIKETLTSFLPKMFVVSKITLQLALADDHRWDSGNYPRARIREFLINSI